MKSFILESTLLIVLMIVVPASIFIDVTVLKNGITEISITEFMQEGFILFSALVFLMASKGNRDNKGLYILVAGLFFMMFIREGDYYLDTIVHGFWKYPVLLVFVTTMYYALPYRNSILASIAQESKTREFSTILIGFLIIVLFSRLLGTTHFWREVMQENYLHLYKTVIQEGLELFGYSIVFYGSVLFGYRVKDS